MKNERIGLLYLKKYIQEAVDALSNKKKWTTTVRFTYGKAEFALEKIVVDEQENAFIFTLTNE